MIDTCTQEVSFCCCCIIQEHNQFIIGSRNYGYGNLREIDEANCIPTRTYDQLVRYWRWYVTDLIKVKGFALNYNVKGNINGLPGKEWDWSDDDDDDDSDEDYSDDDSDNCDDSDNSDDSEEGEIVRTIHWTQTEHDTLVQGMKRYGNKPIKLASLLPFRTTRAVETYIQRHSLHKLRKEDGNRNDDNDDSDNDDTGSEEDHVPTRSRTWTQTERNALIRGIARYGNDHTKLATLIPYRTARAVESYIGRHSLSTLCQGSESDNNDSNISVSSMICEESKELVDDVSNNRHRRWTEQERNAVIRGMTLYGNDYNKLSTLVPRTAKAVRHYITAHSLSSKSKLCDGNYEDNEDNINDNEQRNNCANIEECTSHLHKISKLDFQLENNDREKFIPSSEFGYDDDNDDDNEYRGDNLNGNGHRNNRANIQGHLSNRREISKLDFQFEKNDGKKVIMSSGLDDDDDNGEHEDNFNVNGQNVIDVDVDNVRKHENRNRSNGSAALLSSLYRTTRRRNKPTDSNEEDDDNNDNAPQKMHHTSTNVIPKELRTYCNESKYWSTTATTATTMPLTTMTTMNNNKTATSLRTEINTNCRSASATTSSVASRKRRRTQLFTTARGGLLWTHNERSTLVQGIAKFGQDFEKLVALLKSYNRTQGAIKEYCRRNWDDLVNESEEYIQKCDQTRVNWKDLKKERKTFAEPTSYHKEWTQEERNTLAKGIRQYGRDAKKLSVLMEPHNRSYHAVKTYCRLNWDNLDDENDRYCANKTPTNKEWTQEERSKLARGIAIHGKDIKTLVVLVESYGRSSECVRSYIRRHWEDLVNESKTYCRANAKPTNKGWTQEEKNELARGIAIHDRDYKKLSTLMEPHGKSYRSVVHYCRRHWEELVKESKTSSRANEKPTNKGQSWTQEEKSELARGISIHGRDYKKLFTLMEPHGKSHQSVVHYCRRHWEELVKESEKYYEHEEPFSKTRTWNEVERRKLVRGIAMHGKDFTQLTALMEPYGRNYNSVHNYCRRHWENLEKEISEYEEVDAEAVDKMEIGFCRRKNEDEDAEMEHEEEAENFPKDEFSRHHWTLGEQEKLAVAFALYDRDYGKISKFMKYRKYGGIKSYMQQKENFDKILEASNKCKREHGRVISTIAENNIDRRMDGFTSLTDEQHGMLCEALVLYRNDYTTMEGYMYHTRTAEQIRRTLEHDTATYKDESEFNLASPLSLPVELFHVLNIAPHEGFDHIISWNYGENYCTSFKIHDKGTYIVRYNKMRCYMFVFILFRRMNTNF